MKSFGCGLSITCSTRGSHLAGPFNHLRSSLFSTVKPLSKEWKEHPLRIQVAESIKIASTNLLDAFVESFFKFVEEPMILQGNFGPVNEIGEAVVTRSIEGEIPEEFPQGVYVRNGPNPIFPDKTATISILGYSRSTWFEGDGMIHATYFDKDERGNWTVSYKNRYVESETHLEEKRRNKASFLPALEGDPAAVVAAFLLNQLRMGKVYKDFSNTNVFQHAGKVYCIAENFLPYEIDISNLDTLNVWNMSGPWGRPFTSHPKIDPKTGEMVIMGVEAKKPYYVIGIVSADGNKLSHKVDLKFHQSILAHEIALTEKYNVIMDYPLTVDTNRLIRGGLLIKYEIDQPARIGVMPRYGNAKSIVWFGVTTHCTFHIINSFEDGDEIIVTGCRTTGSIISSIDCIYEKLQRFRRTKPVSAEIEDFDPSTDGAIFPRPYEWRLNMRTGEVKEGYLTGLEFALDFPVINNQFMGMKNKYCYTQVVDTVRSFNTGMPLFNMFAKLYLQEREEELTKEGEERIKVEYHVLEDYNFCSGLQFIQRPGGIDEDHGWLVCYIHNEKTKISQVHIIDAKRFTEEPVAKITLPQRVPYGFHGTYLCT